MVVLSFDFHCFTLLLAAPRGHGKESRYARIGRSLDNTQDAMSSILAFDGDLIRRSLGTNERASKPPARPKHHFIFLPIQIYRLSWASSKKNRVFNKDSSTCGYTVKYLNAEVVISQVVYPK